MPWSVTSERSIRRRPSVQAMQQGGYAVADRPDPNDPMEQYHGVPLGGYSSSQFGSSAQDPRKALDRTALRQSADAQDAADTARHDAFLASQKDAGYIDPVGSRSLDALNKMHWKQSPWREYGQSLRNKGVDRVRTGAVAGHDGPGFFDTQAPSVASLYDGAGEQNRRTYLDTYDTNRAAARRR